MIVAWRGPLGSSLAAVLARAGFTVARAGTAQAEVASARVVADARPEGGGARWIWLSPRAVDARARASAVLAGAYDVIEASRSDATARLLARLAELSAPAEGSRASPPAGGLIGTSATAHDLRAQIARAARTSMPVLVTGETGTGKEVAARLVHAWSTRADARFVPINCAAIPDELMEAELFGYSKGAFSGAVAGFEGWLSAAEGGTVFLDEIDDTPIPLQVKLLRVLEDRVVTRLGDLEPRQVDFRIIAATNRDLRALIARDEFGGDLYERLAIVSIHLAPLRERVEDIPALAAHFIDLYYAREAVPLESHVRGLSADALEALAAYPWPGNIRELRNVVFATLVDKRRGDEILLSDLPRRVLERGAASAGGAAETTWSRPAIERAMDHGRFNLRREVEGLERAALEAALARTSGSPTGAARLLGQVGRGAARDPGGTVRAMMRRLRVP